MKTNLNSLNEVLNELKSYQNKIQKYQNLSNAKISKLQEQIRVLFAEQKQSKRAYNPGDIVIYDVQKNVLFPVAVDEFNNYDYLNDNYYPVGVVVIPDGLVINQKKVEPCMISLLNMSAKTPESGTTKDEYLRFGGFYNEDGEAVGEVIEGLDKFGANDVFKQLTQLEDENNNNATFYGFLPSDKFNGTQCPTGGKYRYNDHDRLLPSPFNADGCTANPLFGKGQNDKPSFLSDLNGELNSRLIMQSVESDEWVTANQIKNNANFGNYPAVFACNRFNPTPYDLGRWFLPAIGQLAFLMPNWNKIQFALKAIADKNSNIAVPLDENYYYWSSSEYSQYYAYLLYSCNGYLKFINKFNNYLVRAFCLLPRI